MTFTTEITSGGNCTGTDGATNRTITMGNTTLTAGSTMLVFINGLASRIGSEYTISHNETNSVLTFLNSIWNDMTIQINY